MQMLPYPSSSLDVTKDISLGCIGMFSVFIQYLRVCRNQITVTTDHWCSKVEYHFEDATKLDLILTLWFEKNC
ncbi:unnamed protein product [Larinioides sclopetarius]|uniref:Uncharacterized protein n=1 Tax=Larinioides sclopetarius TaxID=280406 RepID=A0AAV1ZPX6_9ARAC